MSVSFVDRQTLAAIAPTVTGALGIDNKQYGFLVAAFSVAYLLASPTAGALVDHLGARRGFSIALVVWSVVAAAHGLASSFASLLALRLLLGACEAPTFPAAAQAVRRSLPPRWRTAAVGLIFTGSSFGAMLAAPLALGLTAAFGFRVAFVGSAAVGLLWLPAWLFVTRGARLAPAREAVADASTPPLPWTTLVSSSAVLRALVAIAGSAPALMFLLTFTSKYLVSTWSLPELGLARYLLVPPVLFDIGAVGFGVLGSRRTRANGDAPRGLFLLATALASLLALAPWAPSPSAAIVLFGLAGAGGGGVYVLATADMLARVPAARASSAGGMAAAAQSLAIVVAAPLVGWSADVSGSYRVALVALGLVSLPASLVFLAWTPRLRDAPRATP